MSRFFSSYYRELTPYTPGEQPQDMPYIKLNTNESPFLPSQAVKKAVAAEIDKIPLYPDPECVSLRHAIASKYGVSLNQVFVANGSDDILNAAFMAFGNPETGVAFPDISYGFYSVYQALHHLPAKIIPLKDDFTINIEDYVHCGAMVVIANPNAPTGLALSLDEIERILKTNRDHVVLIDEAYVDFGATSCLPLLQAYDNLLIVQTFSKSRALAGGRLGFALGAPELIADLSTMKYSTNPYNVNRLTLAAGKAAVEDDETFQHNCDVIARTREETMIAMKEMGFSMTESKANFIFAKHDGIGGEELYLALKAKGILVRHFNDPRIVDYNRISVGLPSQMSTLVAALREILTERNAL